MSKQLTTIGLLTLTLLAGVAYGQLPSRRVSDPVSTASPTNGGTSGTSGAKADLANSQVSGVNQSASASKGGDRFANLPSTITLGATIRDFRPCLSGDDHCEEGGHPDFERFSGTTRVGLLADTLGRDGKPVLLSTKGQEIVREFKDSAGRNIRPGSFDASKGDVRGELKEVSDDRITSEHSFSQWYNDTPGVNATKVIDLVLVRQPNSNVYLFDSSVHQPWASRGGFFPANGELYGNWNSTGKNFHFTTEISTQFTYTEGRGDVFTFSGDDDVWVFINNRLVIDLGGVHSRKEQTVQLDRLGLVNAQAYSLKIFHAERRTSGSNFKMETTLQLRNIEKPQITAVFD